MASTDTVNSMQLVRVVREQVYISGDSLLTPQLSEMYEAVVALQQTV